ncbi:hypothetical protein PUNSTDRAFT_44398 [Punctularia strigosozonata HHB-11173 SS5]|uniref:uncharacterized protein n=1 Tax=Punctularia strigosozonata (strain HHB-11173) TaxID=741275 RepID=UPI00044169F7|nr:uncharacterized protein PUNSTDRAFT_44398 [Punctularia strigosozonata HHB-11173 SS5]EIN08881.1 hypothetical protein PUNSTDRAFT_44398 [Punctularia strigosozonata HHB-11173 SS5]
MLPPEILGFIIEKLDDEVDVRACALTYQRMLPHARTSFWRRMTLVKDEHIRTVLELLDHIPEIARYIRKLHVHTYLSQSGPPTAPPVGKDGTTQNHMRDLLLRLTYLDELALASLPRGISKHEAKDSIYDHRVSSLRAFFHPSRPECKGRQSDGLHLCVIA